MKAHYFATIAMAGLSPAICFAKADKPDGDTSGGAGAPEPAADAGAPEQEGVRARRSIMLKQFLPGEGIDWINKNIVAAGKGTRATFGRIYGTCTGYEVRTNTLPDGTPAQSIALKGDFETENFMTGEIGSGTLAFIPAAYSEKVKAIFDANAILNDEGREIGNHVRTVEVDIDVGVEATGKTIPYEWVVVAFREGAEMATLKKLRNSRQRPAYVMRHGEGDKAVMIEAKPRPQTAPLALLEAPAPAADADDPAPVE